MHLEQQIALVRRILVHVEAKTTDADPSGTTLEVGAYANRERIEREIAVLFRDRPLPIAHRAELPSPGDFVTHDRSGAPLLVVRRDDGGLDAFLNVCRHRGTKVESAASGSKRAFSCPYHGWTYDRRGRLATVPHVGGFACVDREQRGLVRVAAGETAGLVFVRPRALAVGEPAELAPESLLDPILARELQGFGLDRATATTWAPRSVDYALCWKLAIDIFLESYHLRPTHKSTIYPMFFDNLGLVDRVGPHLRNVFPKRTIRELANEPTSSWELRRHANVLYHLFPATLVLIQPDHAAIVHVWPTAPDRTTVSSYLVIPEAPATEKARGYWDANAAVLYEATDEDFAMGTSIQAGLAAGANREVVFGAFEHALAHFHHEIARQTGGG
jgi:phenylpropionate dioxygenase-like ring-hydroxylating dioxygenase large terminal subunit